MNETYKQNNHKHSDNIYLLSNCSFQQKQAQPCIYQFSYIILFCLASDCFEDLLYLFQRSFTDRNVSIHDPEPKASWTLLSIRDKHEESDQTLLRQRDNKANGDDGAAILKAPTTSGSVPEPRSSPSSQLLLGKWPKQKTCRFVKFIKTEVKPRYRSQTSPPVLSGTPRSNGPFFQNHSRPKKTPLDRIAFFWPLARLKTKARCSKGLLLEK